MPVVVVESPAKAKTINKYLGSDYSVFASYGHVRDLPPKDGSVDPQNNFEMLWEVSTDSKKHIKAISDALKKDNTLILATDPDREGEAISWHLEEALRKRRAINGNTQIQRVVFNAITKSAVSEAMKAPREIDSPLVEAYLARRALDYLVGFNLSPVLWRKLPGARSAGRVQSVSVRLIVEREIEINAFVPQETFKIQAIFSTQGHKKSITSYLTKTFESLHATKTFLNKNKLAEFSVDAIEKKPASKSPTAPFTTSTLQQEASRKLFFSVSKTMNMAPVSYTHLTLPTIYSV